MKLIQEEQTLATAAAKAGMDEKTTGKYRDLKQLPSQNEIHPQISPDGKWIAYTHNSEDNRNEIYVQSFPTGTDRYQISNKGGDWPRWRGDTKELFYFAIGNNNSPDVSAGAVTTQSVLRFASIGTNGTVLEPGAPQDLMLTLSVNLPHSGGSYVNYAVDPKSDHFLIVQFVAPTAATTNTQIGPDTFSGLTVALNWASALKN